MTTKFRFAAIQMAVGHNKATNLKRAESAVEKAVQAGANVISLPECFNSPYSTDMFRQHGEKVPSVGQAIEGRTVTMLSKLAKEHGIYLIGGSLPELDEDKVYNTSVVFDPSGNVIAKHRKVHLFDIDIPGKITFKESDTLTAGSEITLFDTKYGRFGLGICYDLRFAPLSQIMTQDGAKFLLFPGAFNTTTGPMHWELLLRARATDNQVFVCGISPARATDGKGYQAWGHSSVVDPWGKVVATTEHGEDIVYADIDLSVCDEVRSQIPIGVQNREDLYEVKKRMRAKKVKL